ncbi:GIY-YIG nuclease family protein [Breoghania sp. L-A4]|uniref:GIY-YIG nuclease family protein n=1 Tax=Breoghania sp. L-A4 TaxID=2304600 RepID=UPI000E35FBC2|nr:GIY-YIG nuclease family protein [Breoghania sp. L-A4]AXS40232.1 GIY-YIG nuclease family protein [Breoghania sp. L-A4]
MGATVYILRCANGRYYTGITRRDLAHRLHEHQSGLLDGYTARHRPLELAFSEHFEVIAEAVAFERQTKGWSRAKKEALIAGDYARLPALSRRGAKTR